MTFCSVDESFVRFPEWQADLRVNDFRTLFAFVK